MNHLVYITKADGTKELFEENKLIESLERVGATQAQIDDITAEVGKQIENDMPTSEIYRRAFDLLRKTSMPTAIKYSLRRALSELGPEGYPFERYIAKLLEEYGYSTLTGQIVSGKCVDHEMDIVAWKKEKLVMIEAKFHNEFGFKSDVKVALYVKARFDDLKNARFSYGGEDRPLDEGWLVTNTKFTDQAIKYGECQGLKMIGWNYPATGNLHEMIEKTGLHPFTCLSSLSNVHKKTLLSQGTLLCRDISRNPKSLTDLGLDQTHVDQVMQEISQVCGITS